MKHTRAARGLSGRLPMLSKCKFTTFPSGLALVSLTLLTSSVLGQTPAARSDKQEKQVAAVKLPDSVPVAPSSTAAKPESTPDADDPKTKDVKDELEAMKAENAAVREQLRKMEETQKATLEQ